MTEMDAILKQIESRMQEIQPLIDEYQRLESAREQLSRGGSKSTVSKSARPTGRRRRGGHAQTLMEYVSQHPGTTVTDASNDLGIQRNYSYRIVSDLVNQGQLRKQGRELFATQNPAPAEQQSDNESSSSDWAHDQSEATLGAGF